MDERAERGDPDSAEAAFRETLRAAPDDADALQGLASLLLESRRAAEACAILARLLRRPDATADMVNDYGMALRGAGKARLAAAQFRKALSMDPGHANAAANLAYTLTGVGDAAGAVGACRRAVEISPSDAALHNALGVALSQQRDDRAAELAFRDSLRCNPRSLEALWNLAALYTGRGEELRAVRPLRRALGIDPNSTPAMANLSLVYRRLGRRNAAEGLLRQAIALSPELPELHVGLGLLLLAREEYEEGWAEYEFRLQSREFALPELGAPQWRGESNPGGTLIVLPEQGFGDNIQFCRYLYMIGERWQGRVVYCVGPELFPLFSASGLPAEIACRPPFTPYPHQGCDAFIGLMSLPGIFHTSAGTIPASVPYLRAPEERTARWNDRLGSGQDLRIGLAWTGSKYHPNDRRRSCHVSQLAPLAGIPGVKLYSLQVGPDAGPQTGGPDCPGIENLGAGISDFADTAAILQKLDLLISVDSAPAHLAGALGRPAWVVLPFDPDWRWQLGREDSPWYPTVRLFRQERTDEWAPVWERVAMELRRFAESRTADRGSD